MLRFMLWFRYRVTIKGLDKLNPQNLKKPGGILFMPNHPAVFVDPASIAVAIWSKYEIRPMIVEYFYFQPVVHWLMKYIRAVPVPNFDTSGNSLKRKRSNEVIQLVIDDLKKGDNFLIYPAGRTKQTELEIIGGASGIHRIISETPEANIVLIRIKGLWGSSFSRALSGKAPPLFPTILTHMKYIFMNLIFFTPRREITIEFEIAPPDFPYDVSRIEMNRWLERWYNKPDGLTKQNGEYPGDSLIFKSYSMWGEVVPKRYEEKKENSDIAMMDISKDVQIKVIDEIARIIELKPEDIQLNMTLDRDLGMDSLDISELGSFIQDYFDVKVLSVPDMTTVAKAIAIADKKIKCKEETVDNVAIDYKKWTSLPPRKKLQVAPGDTIPEVFLNNCSRMGSAPGAADERSGILSYKDLKLRSILLAEYIRKLPGETIGVLLPSSVAAYVVILACQLAGKIPLIINWTVGARHLEAVRKLSNVQVVLTSWTFIDRLENVDLTGVDDILVMLEDVKRELNFKDKLKAFWRSKMSNKYILKCFGVDKVSKDDRAVLLFTSGTESMPKGVPLTHDNILSNQRQAFDTVDLYSDDIICGILPPFHAFGFTVTGLLALVSGIRAVYSPDPKDSKKLASTMKNWNVTVMCGAPTFLKGMFRVGTPEDFKTIRICVTGAEKAPPDLFKVAELMGKKDSIIEGYGITECSPILTINRPGQPNVGVGEPVKGVELKIVNPNNLKPLDKMQRGLVIVRGPNIFSGYLNPNAISPFVTVDGKEWYNTGDLGYLDDYNRLIISGRQKRFIKIGGEMISLAAIEEAFLQSTTKMGWPTSEEGPTLAVCAKEEPGYKTRIFLFTVFDTTIDEVNSVLRAEGFSNLIKISSVIKLDAIPIMGTGKIFYRELENTYLDH